MQRFVPSRTQQEGNIKELAREFHVSERVMEALFSRGLTDSEKIKKFLSPSLKDLNDPFLLPDMEKAVSRIRRAISEHEPICVYGDYDVDGICATALLLLALRSRGANVVSFLPSRFVGGYGMNKTAVEQLKQQGISLIITVDNGISAREEIKLCTELNMDVVVTDHHSCPDLLPECVAVVNPTRIDSVYPTSYLSGAGIAYKLIEALYGREFAFSYLPFAGVAAVADVVPLLGENRVFVSETLKRLNAHTCPIGLQALADNVRRNSADFVERDISFGIAPRINAAGRLGDADISLSLLCETDEKCACVLTEQLCSLNAKRQDMVDKMRKQAEEMLAPVNVPATRVIVLHRSDWNIGVAGIVASKITEKYYRPTILFCGSGEEITGSGRSFPGVNLFEALKANGHYFVRYGGHAGAAGMTIRREDLEPLRSDLEAYLQKNIPDEVFIRSVSYESELPPSEVSLSLAKELAILAPFGEGNPKPTFGIFDVGISDISFMGNEKQYARFTAQSGNASCKTVAFQGAEELHHLIAGARYDLICELSVNEWNGAQNPQLSMTALKTRRSSFREILKNSGDEKFFNAFLRNLLYNSHIDPSETEPVAQCSLSELFGKQIAGALVLCFTKLGAESALNELEGSRLFADVSFTAPKIGQEGYHAVVLAPVLGKIPFEWYDRIMIYDSAVAPELLQGVLSAAREHGARLFHGETHTPWNPFAGIDVSREALIGRYRMLRSEREACYRGSKFDTLIRRMSEKSGESAESWAFSAQVFRELGFFTGSSESGWRLAPSPAHRELSESKTYSFAVDFAAKSAEYETILSRRR